MPAAALVAVLAACSTAPIQGTTTQVQPTKTGAVVTTPISGAKTATTGAVTIGSKGPVVGVNLYALRNYTAIQTTVDGERTLSYIKNSLHASAVDLVWDMYVPEDHANTIVTNGTTLSATNIGILTQIAQHYGLYVEYRPMLFVQTSGNTWEGKVQPSDPSQWFGSYYSSNLPYLEMAQKYHINEYVIGTEMNDLTPDAQWTSFLAKSATVFQGEISYTQNQYMYFPPLTQLPPTDLTGVDMYEPLNKVLPSASLETVVAAYEAFFATMPSSLLHRTAIQETGIEARAGAYVDPPNLGKQGQLDEAVQYNWFTAGCETVKRFHLRGIFFWKVDLTDYPVDHPASSLSTFEGKSGAMAIAQCASIIKG
jgi:hypothetical protein